MAVSNKLNFILKQNEKNKLSHAFLIETNNLVECEKEIREIIKILNCPESFDDKCDKCNVCKLIDLDNLPTLITIRPDGMSIKKQQMEELEQKFSTKPVYSKYNTYVISGADKMNDAASNSILKFLEEPEDDIVGFLIVSNKENVLSTIKSRCEIVHVDYDVSEELDENIKNLADEYLDQIINSDDYLINKKLILSTYVDRKDIETLFICMLNKYYQDILNTKDNNEHKKISEIITLIQKMLNFIEYNVNLELILDCFVIEMRKIAC